VPDQIDAEILQILGGQARQHRGIDGVVAKRLLVLLQPESAEQCGNVHARLPAAVTAASLIVPRIVGAGEYSARLVSPRSRDAPVAIAGGGRPSSGERYGKAGRWPGRRLVAFGSRAVKLSVSICSPNCPR
jgi:hypothetical protein